MLIVAIAGGSGSGKTTVAEQLHNLVLESGYSCANLCEDRYYHSLNKQQLANISDVDFDHPDAINHHQLSVDLANLQQGKTIEAPHYCYKTHQQLPQSTPLPPTDVFILEGLHLLHRTILLPHYDETIFVDTPTEVRLQRRVDRDVKERQRTVKSVTEQFYKTVEPAHSEFIQPSKANAGIVVDGTQPLDQLMPFISKRVFNKLS